MKLKETLAEKANKAQTEEEINATIEDAGMELSEDELDEVSGGKNYDIKVMILWMEDLMLVWIQQAMSLRQILKSYNRQELPVTNDQGVGSGCPHPLFMFIFRFLVPFFGEIW